MLRSDHGNAQRTPPARRDSARPARCTGTSKPVSARRGRVAATARRHVELRGVDCWWRFAAPRDQDMVNRLALAGVRRGYVSVSDVTKVLRNRPPVGKLNISALGESGDGVGASVVKLML